MRFPATAGLYRPEALQSVIVRVGSSALAPLTGGALRPVYTRRVGAVAAANRKTGLSHELLQKRNSE